MKNERPDTGAVRHACDGGRCWVRDYRGVAEAAATAAKAAGSEGPQRGGGVGGSGEAGDCAGIDIKTKRDDLLLVWLAAKEVEERKAAEKGEGKEREEAGKEWWKKWIKRWREWWQSIVW